MKKKRIDTKFDYRILSRKNLLFMKFVIIILVVTCLSARANVFSQRMIVNIDLQDVSLNQLFKELSKQTRCDFLYNHTLLKTKGSLNIKASNKPLEQLLGEILPGFGLEYFLDDNVVIIRECSKSTDEKKSLTINGRVTDEQKNPLPGVTIIVKGLKVGTSTDVNGKFKIYIPGVEECTLFFSFIGMETQEVKYSGKDSLHVVMKEASEQLEEVIVNTGYERIDPRKTTSAIQSIKAEDIVVSGLTSIDQMLEGHVPGMIFMQNTGQIGATPRLRIRGTSTVLGSQEPLWVIDGIVQENPVDVDPQQINDLDFVNLLGNAITGLNPEDISQIDILKDASATALYGAKAANGVIVITTKKGKQGPPTLSYSLSGSFMRRPHYSDNSVFMMNSKARIDFSRELIEKRVTYPQVTSWMGYEKPLRNYWSGLISFEEMQKEVGYYESVNTDWFDILMQNSFSHKHTLSLSGGSSALRYYVSAGFADTRGNIKGEENKQYTANINLTANYQRLSIRFGFNGNVMKKKYTPNDVEVPKYAYETTRALPAYNEDGSLWFYSKDTGYAYRDYNIINDVNNTSQDIRSSGLTVTASLDYQFNEALKASFTASYSTNNTTQEIWHGENSFYAEILRRPQYNGTDKNGMPFGGELQYQNTERYAYTVRGQINFNKTIDAEQKHLITSSIGGEVSSNQYFGLDQTFRGYLKERGKKMAGTDLSEYPYFEEWKGSDPKALGVWTDKLTNMASTFATFSYTYNNLYTLNANVRLDASNRFGSRANEKLAPIWSVSARWNIKDDLLPYTKWVSSIALRGSFGYQGNMLDTESAKLVLTRGGLDPNFEEYESYVSSYPNPNLKWEKTESYNLTLDFSLFKGRVNGNFTYFYKNTKNAFLSKTISAINGVNNWVVNQGTLKNQGLEGSLSLTIIDSKSRNANGFRWTMSPNIGQIFNKVSGNSKDQTLTNEITYSGFLDGSVEIQGRPLNSFYSYKFHGLNASNGLPMFYGSDRYQYVGNQKVDLLKKYQELSPSEVFTDVMEYSGTRVPTLQGGVQNSLSWRRFSVSLNLTYSFGSKIRLLKMYPNVNSDFNTIAPQPTDNVRKEFLSRWRQPGDELHTNVPGIVSSSEFTNTLNTWMWWYSLKNTNGESIKFAGNIWDMYDNSNLRTVSGDFVKIQSLSIRYNFPDDICTQLRIKSAYIGFTGTNLHTFCNKKLKGQDPATQDGIAPTINMSLRPTYSFNLNVSF